MGGTVLPPCSLAWGGPVLESCSLYGRGIVSVRPNDNLLQEDLCQQAAPPRTTGNSVPVSMAGRCWPVPLQ